MRVFLNFLPMPLVMLSCACSNAYSNGFNSVPLPFPAAFIPRDQDRVTVVKAEYSRAMTEVSKYGIL